MIKLKSLIKEIEAPKRIPRDIMLAESDLFTRSYIETALATTNDESTQSGGNPLDQNYDIEDIEGTTFIRMLHDCRDFQRKYRELYEKGGWSDEKAGRDFWYTRNGHGTGFWDAGYGEPEVEEIGKALSRIAKSYGTYDIYLGQGGYDGLICGA